MSRGDVYGSYSYKGEAKTVGELIDILSKLPKDFDLDCFGSSCHIITNPNRDLCIIDTHDSADERFEELEKEIEEAHKRW